MKPRPSRRPAIEPRAFTKREAAIYMGISLASFDKLKAQGRIQAIRYPGIRRDFFDREMLDQGYRDESGAPDCTYRPR